MEYKTVKIPAWAYDNALAAKGIIARRGLDALPDEIRSPTCCPRCGDEVVISGAGVVECAAGCGYLQDQVGDEGIGLGVLLGLGVTALLEELAGRAEETAREKLRAKARDALVSIRAAAAKAGLAKMTPDEIEAEIRESRRKRSPPKTARGA